jgi:hypothetical protein
MQRRLTPTGRSRGSSNVRASETIRSHAKSILDKISSPTVSRRAGRTAAGLIAMQSWRNAPPLNSEPHAWVVEYADQVTPSLCSLPVTG